MLTPTKMPSQKYNFPFHATRQLGKNSNANTFYWQEDDKPFSLHLSDESFETYELDPPPYTMDTTKKELKQMYYDMVSVRYKVFLPTTLSMLIGLKSVVWRWQQTDSIRRRKSADSAISPQAKKPLLLESNTPSQKKMTSSPHTAATATLCCAVAQSNP